MPWTTETFKAAYRLTQMDTEITNVLAASSEDETRWLGARVGGGTAAYTWHLRLFTDGFHQSLGLPAQGDRLVSLEHDGNAITDGYLSDNGRSIRRETLVLPFIYGAYTAQVVLVDDTARRDELVAQLTLERLGMLTDIKRRSWRRILRDLRGDSLPGRLPDERAVVTTTGGVTNVYYAGTVESAGDPVALAGLTVAPGRSGNLPAWTGFRYVVFASHSSREVTGVSIGGIDQTPAFRRSEFTDNGGTFVEWRSRRAWDGGVASLARYTLL